MFSASFFILFKIAIVKYIVSNGVGKMNVVFFLLICPFLNCLQGQLEQEREELKLQNEEDEMLLQRKDQEV